MTFFVDTIERLGLTLICIKCVHEYCLYWLLIQFVKANLSYHGSYVGNCHMVKVEWPHKQVCHKAKVVPTNLSYYVSYIGKLGKRNEKNCMIALKMSI